MTARRKDHSAECRKPHLVLNLGHFASGSRFIRTPNSCAMTKSGESQAYSSVLFFTIESTCFAKKTRSVAAVVFEIFVSRILHKSVFLRPVVGRRISRKCSGLHLPPAWLLYKRTQAAWAEEPGRVQFCPRHHRRSFGLKAGLRMTALETGSGSPRSQQSRLSRSDLLRCC